MLASSLRVMVADAQQLDCAMSAGIEYIVAGNKVGARCRSKTTGSGWSLTTTGHDRLQLNSSTGVLLIHFQHMIVRHDHSQITNGKQFGSTFPRWQLLFQRPSARPQNRRLLSSAGTATVAYSNQLRDDR